jgi:phosphatidylethanolamine-binding protein (PEBP) family uncharacterized protein
MFKWFHWIYTDNIAQARAENQGYAPLSENVRDKVLDLLNTVKKKIMGTENFRFNVMAPICYKLHTFMLFLKELLQLL